ncbi:MAG TPA: glycosyl hydrolase 115 family protein [Gemmatimonadaceae bacterium]|nr:glycosyl hydrolase 115 family protein [Gemmatimonadaceae bacterium]
MMFAAVVAATLASAGVSYLGAQPSGGQPERYVASGRSPGSFPLAVDGRPAHIFVSSSDYPGVIRAANDLRLDLGRVTGTDASLHVHGAPNDAAVIVGTIGSSTLVDRLVKTRKLDVKGIAGRWETFLVQVVKDPLPGVDQALVIVGSDRRGTIYGIYDLSAQIGVSPWYWWADVPTRRQPDLYVQPGRHTAGEPAVKYRGIFINDEAPAFSGWTRETFGGVNHKVYEKVFELVLRLKGNYLWPAMWGNAFADDDSLNARLAQEYGIVMGTSHHEPLTRAQQEWRRYGKGPWNYEQNDSTLRDFWRKGVDRMVNGPGGARENIVTIGMRGDGDMPMTEGSNIALLERIVADQRRIITDVTQRDASATPQLWALYKEVQDYYDKGMRVPEDVTLLFADDNWGNVRRLPAAAERKRPGGFGVYYHFDYVGGPRNYKWINTNPIARVWEQMNLSYRLGADRIWIVNVGDIKPMEFPIQFFLDFAWNPNAWPAERLGEYTRRWAEQQFGPQSASDIADVVTKYLKYAGRRKPELLAPETYSIANYSEADRIVADYAGLARRARAIGETLPPAYKDAYYQLVLHPVLAAANLNELYVTVAKNRLYALQGRASTNDYADRARELFQRDAEISRFFNDTLAGGKWSHMMDQTHIGYTYWQEPPRNVMPRTDVIQVPLPGELGVSWDGQVPFVPGGQAPPPGGFRFREPALPEFDSFQRQSSWIDVFNRGKEPVEFRVETGQPWLDVSPRSGTLTKDQRLIVSVDWSRAPVGLHRVPITVTSGASGERRFVLQAPVRHAQAPSRDDVNGFVQGNGVVAMESEHYSRAVSVNGFTWQRVPDLGRTMSGMATVPGNASQKPGVNAARLEYRMFVFDSGSVQVKAYVSPTHNFSGVKDGLRYAVSFDDEPPQVVNTTADTSSAAWERSVADNIKIFATRHQLATPGAHVLKFWAVDPGVVLQRIVVDLGGERPSYLGPPESFYRPAPASSAATGSGQPNRE